MRYLTEEWDQNQYTAGFHEKVEAHEERGGRMTSQTFKTFLDPKS